MFGTIPVSQTGPASAPDASHSSSTAATATSVDAILLMVSMYASVLKFLIHFQVMAKPGPSTRSQTVIPVLSVLATY